MYDLVIRNGTVIDGSGSAGQQRDVAINNGLIAAIGPNLAAGEQEIFAGAGRAASLAGYLRCAGGSAGESPDQSAGVGTTDRRP
ncbi:MAG: hypothetical protein AAGC55_10055 [Myxococcota bacterium]